ncbi:iron uptake porin [Chroococcidiopsidales cyanobacterium LEGE 13417]|nr:iron uptake porin [Chroococcidiopsidales cyanobacterium LEGE 13417]
MSSVAASTAAPTPKTTKVSELQAAQIKALKRETNSIEIIHDKPKGTASGADVLEAGKPEATIAQATAISSTEYSNAMQAIPATSLPGSASPISSIRANPHSNEDKLDDSLAQVTSVSQLSDVQPNDWAFQALQSLVERYGCIAGYPDGTYRGNRALTRYEFAAGLNACLDRVNELIATATADNVTKEDLATLQRLQEEFSTELATLRGRVDALEAQTSELEANQFSTTTKLNGQVIFALSGAVGKDKAVPSGVTAGSAGRVDENFTLSNRVLLDFETSFTGKDTLTVSLYANNFPDFRDVTGTNMGRLVYERDTVGSTENDLGVFYLAYEFPIGDRLTVLVEPYGGVLGDFVDLIDPYFGDVKDGAVSAFGYRSPIYSQVGFGSGAGLTYEFSDAVNLSLAYLASEAENLTSGLTGGPFVALAQLTLKPTDTIALGLTYVRSYNGLDAGVAGVGSTYSNDPFDGESYTSDSYGLAANFQINPKIALGGWAGYTRAEAVSGAIDGANASIFYYAVTLAFPDLLREGNLGGIVVGLPPKVTSNDINDREDRDSSLHLEAFYRFQVTRNIGITPGLLVITNPEHNKDNDTIYVGTIRTTFSF